MRNFSSKGYQIRQNKFAKNWKMLFSKAQYIRVGAQCRFKTIFLETPTTKFWFKQSWTLCLTFPGYGFNFVTQKFPKNWKMPFSNTRNILFEPKVASKPFSKKLTTSKLWFKDIWTLCVTFPSNGFNFVTQKIAKSWKMLFSNAHNIRFWAQGSFKTIFLDACYDQIWI